MPLPPVRLTGGGQYPFPLGGGRLGWGEEVLSSPPPEPSPVKGEGSGSQAARMTYLPLFDPRGGEDFIRYRQQFPFPDKTLQTCG
jgi:hypothetical protein